MKLNLNDLKSEKPEIKYHCAKKAIALSEKNPQALYLQIDTFIKLLDGENNVLKWVAIIVIGNLAAADKKNKINRLVPKLIGFLREKSMITANNTIRALGKIAANKPKLQEKIFKALLGVEKAVYYNKGKISPECRNIALGKVIDVFSEFREETKNRRGILAFVRRQTKNTRPTVRKRALQFIRVNWPEGL
ncbi:MAG: hypothetical protein WCV50_06020 [Patescibacteria group bacterium]